MITEQHLVKLGVPSAIANEWTGPLISAMNACEINTTQRTAAFLAQLIHESSGLRTLAESFNYTPAALMATFNTKRITRFPKILADEYGRTTDHKANQPMIAMIAYADRMGNGPVDSGDGWRYHGRGPIQLTGKSNYKAFGESIKLDVLRNPERVLEPVIGAMAAAWFWSTNKLNSYADKGKIDEISRIVNGGENGLEHRRSLYEQALKVLKDA